MCATAISRKEATKVTRLTLPATAEKVREGLAQLLDSPALRDLAEEDRGTAELLLAEVLNNVVEHAYARWPGDIAIGLKRVSAHIEVSVSDRGLPMPDAAPPTGDLPDMGGADLPEGGFGWFLIRSLAQNLHYARKGEVNELTFQIPVDNWEA